MVTLVVVWVFMNFKIVWFKKNAALDSYCAQAARDSTLEAQNYQETDCIILSCLCFVSCSFVKSENLRKQSILFFVTKLSLRRMYWKSHISFLVGYQYVWMMKIPDILLDCICGIIQTLVWIWRYSMISKSNWWFQCYWSLLYYNMP
jgi:hypothetical protein